MAAIERSEAFDWTPVASVTEVQSGLAPLAFFFYIGLVTVSSGLASTLVIGLVAAAWLNDRWGLR